MEPYRVIDTGDEQSLVGDFRYVRDECRVDHQIVRQVGNDGRHHRRVIRQRPNGAYPKPALRASRSDEQMRLRIDGADIHLSIGGQPAPAVCADARPVENGEVGQRRERIRGRRLDRSTLVLEAGPIAGKGHREMEHSRAGLPPGHTAGTQAAAVAAIFHAIGDDLIAAGWPYERGLQCMGPPTLNGRDRGAQRLCQ